MAGAPSRRRPMEARNSPPSANRRGGRGSGVTLGAAAMAPERGDRSLPAGTEGLPRVFLQSLRTLFDILDDRRRGYVHLREIESRWRGAEAQELPAGVMEGLRQAAPASGYLTFERFVLGLRAALPGTEPPVEGGSGGRRSAEKPPSPRCSEERWGKSTGQREPGPGQPRGRGGDAKSAGQPQGDTDYPGARDTRRHQRGRAEHRRHTITNGVDFSTLKYMKELEQEKDFLLQGLELIERAREWYHQHIQLMQEHQRFLGKGRTSADFPEGGQSHLGRLVPKLQEVNRCLGDLLSTASKAANPSSALSKLVPVTSPASTGSQQAINILKEQNRLLTKEVTDKSERITQLEQEKSALIKQLFEARAHNNHEMSQLDSTFI
ncbi:LOW QUALITY PROTEIN: suppressor APC domain-containing protein 2 [Molothrus aeneus]|uniref:LOW QUALITY PROTEIN: suppressor APC domain-containing protein 2 n=1 Tax=Molothrus ater TaxID=84834 RepID=UPI00174DC53A|nr:LOW QUALITY PROTEIN: suppressor APC domain-containing protein 2 [Molothrus ater]